MEIVLYKLNGDDQGVNDATLDTLRKLGFLVTQVSPLKCVDGPSPVAHFCGKGVMFGQEAIISFARQIKQKDEVIFATNR